MEREETQAAAHCRPRAADAVGDRFEVFDFLRGGRTAARARFSGCTSRGAQRGRLGRIFRTGRRGVTLLLSVSAALGEAMCRGILRAAVEAVPGPMLDELRLERIAPHDCSSAAEEGWHSLRAASGAAVRV